MRVGYATVLVMCPHLRFFCPSPFALVEAGGCMRPPVYEGCVLGGVDLSYPATTYCNVWPTLFPSVLSPKA